MTKTDENKLAMLKAVVKLLRRFQSDWENISRFATAVVELESMIVLINAARENGDSNQSGLVAEKKTIQKMLIDKAYEILSQLYVLAIDTQDQMLESKVKYTKSDLQAMRDSVLVSTCNSTVKIGRERLDALVQYNVVNDDLTGLENLNTSFESRLPEFRASVSEQKAGNMSMKSLIKNGANLVKLKLNRMMVPFEKSKPNFYAAYINATKVVAYGTRYEKPEEPATVTNQPQV
jgi:hypothetical protein